MAVIRPALQAFHLELMAFHPENTSWGYCWAVQQKTYSSFLLNYFYIFAEKQPELWQHYVLYEVVKKNVGVPSLSWLCLYIFSLSKLFSRNDPGLRGHKSKPIPAISKRLMPEINWANLIPWRAIYQALYTIIYYKLCRNKDNSTKKKTLVL